MSRSEGRSSPMEEGLRFDLISQVGSLLKPPRGQPVRWIPAWKAST